MTFEEASILINRIQYKDWTIKLSRDPFYIQLLFSDSEGTIWTSRKWLLSEHMTPSEVVQTVLKAVLTAEEHEAREAFLFDGYAIFGPHIDIYQLRDMIRVEGTSVLDFRPAKSTILPYSLQPNPIYTPDYTPGEKID